METTKGLVHLGTVVSVMAFPSTNSCRWPPDHQTVTFLIHLCVQLPYTWDTRSDASNWPMVMARAVFPKQNFAEVCGSA